MEDRKMIDHVFSTLNGLDKSLVQNVRKDTYYANAKTLCGFFRLSERTDSKSPFDLFSVTKASKSYNLETEKRDYLRALLMMYVIKGANTDTQLPFLKTKILSWESAKLITQIFWVHKYLNEGEDKCRENAARIAKEWTFLPDGQGHSIKKELRYTDDMGNCQGHVKQIMLMAGCFSHLNTYDFSSSNINTMCNKKLEAHDLWLKGNARRFGVKPGTQVVFVPRSAHSANHVVMFVGHGLISGYDGPCYMSANTPTGHYPYQDKHMTGGDLMNVKKHNLFNGKPYGVSPRLMKHEDLVDFCPKSYFPRMVALENPPWKCGTRVLR
jgi:hypothetical protein